MAAVGVAQEFPLSSDPETIGAVRFSSPPKIDGTIGADEWAGIGTSARSLVMRSTNQNSGQKGQVWIGYDDEYLYIAARILLKDPTNISADEFRDNVNLGGNDTFTFELDTFGTLNDITEIKFNANGATELEIAGGRAAKTEWSGRAEAAGSITETGWEGEVRVPWKLIPLPPSGVRDMRFNIGWYVSSTRRSVAFHTTQDDPTRMHTWSGVDVPEVSRKQGVLLLPYGYAGVDDNDEHIANAGLDLKTNLTSDVFLVGTFNPDFRNIEGDILDLDFSNFERLADETRPFFQEGSDYFFFGHGRRLFASQRIQSFDTGVNVYGNLGGSSRFGILNTMDYGNQALTAGSYTFNPDPLTEFTGSFVSLQRAGEDNTGGRFAASRRQGSWLVFGETNVTDDEIIGTGNASTVGAFYNRPGWESNLFLVDVSGDFFPRAGFASETDFTGYSGSVTRELEFTSGTVTQVEIDFDFTDYDRRGGGHYRERLDLGVELTLNNIVELEFGTAYSHFLDRHDNVQTVKMQYPKNDPYRQIQVEYEFGDILDTDYESIEARIRYRPFKRLQLGLRAQVVRHIEDEEQVIASFNWEMDRYQSIGGRAVFQDDKWNWFASYRMSGNEGAEYFLIVGDPNADTFQRSLIFKISMPLTIGG